jgi:hypothetical protein
VSVFRPSARITGPDGRLWEIYAYKLDVHDRSDWDTDVVDPPVPQPELFLVNLLVGLVMLVPRALMRLFDVTAAAVRALQSDEWTIEAVTWLPQKQSYVWTTTGEYRGQVLAQVEGSLTRGDVPQHLRNATYLGWRRSAR